jgi:hypothetical protein
MFCFNGCSFTFGEGFCNSDRLRYTYPYVVGEQTNTPVENIAIKGSSNYLTFMRSASAIQSNKFNAVFTQWTIPTRLWLFPGPDTQFFTNDQNNAEYTYREIHLSKNKKRTFTDTLLMLNGEFQCLIDLVGYCKILDSVASTNNTKSYYINGLLQWTKDLFATNNYNDMDNSFSTYTKDLLDFDNRNDDELSRFHYKLSSTLKTLNTDMWINMFESMDNNIVDLTPANHHPGIKTNKWMANKIITHMGK